MTKQKMIYELSKLKASNKDLDTLFRVSSQFLDIEDLKAISPQKITPKLEEINECLKINLKNLKPALLYKSIFFESFIEDKDNFDFSKIYHVKRENYNKVLVGLKLTDSSIHGSKNKELNNFQYSIKNYWEPILTNAYEINAFFERLSLKSEETIEKIYFACWPTTFLLGF